MTAAQKQKLLQLLDDYVKKFGFGVVFAVRDYTTASLIEAFENRLANDRQTELAVACRETERLASLLVQAFFDRHAG